MSRPGLNVRFKRASGSVSDSVSEPGVSLDSLLITALLALSEVNLSHVSGYIYRRYFCG